MKKIIILISLLILLPVVMPAQTDVSIDSLIIMGKQHLQKALNNWKEPDLFLARAFFERIQPDSSHSWLIHYYLGLADYRIVSFYFSQQQLDQAKKYIEDGIQHLESAIRLRADFAEAYSLLSSLYGNKIATDPMLGMTLGPKSGTVLAKALKLAPQNPRTQLISGWSAYFTPKMWGGGKDKAKKYFQQAIVYYDSFKVDSSVLPDWGHEEAYAWLGLANMEDGEFDRAKINFDKSLEINPEYSWVTYVLLPDLKKKIAVEK